MNFHLTCPFCSAFDFRVSTNTSMSSVECLDYFFFRSSFSFYRLKMNNTKAIKHLSYIPSNSLSIKLSTFNLKSCSLILFVLLFFISLGVIVCFVYVLLSQTPMYLWTFLCTICQMLIECCLFWVTFFSERISQ